MRDLLTFQLLGPQRTKPEQRAASMRETRDRLRALPGVESVTAATPFPLTGNFNPIRWGTAEALTDPSKFQAVDLKLFSPATLKQSARRVNAGAATL